MRTRTIEGPHEFAPLEFRRMRAVEPVAEPLLPPTSLDDIALSLRSLTYGEMIELAGGLWTARDDGDITSDSLPAVLHRWATRR